MINWLKKPKSSDVSKYIDRYWFIEKTSAATGYSFPKLNPDPCAHLIISPQKQSYCYNCYCGTYQGEGSHWLFPHHQTFQLDHSKPFMHLGIKFHVGALYSLEIPNYLHPKLDVVDEVTINKLLNSNTTDENELIAKAQSNAEQCCEQLDTILLPWLLAAQQDQHSKITSKSLQLLDSTSISELGDKLFCSQRTLERSFNRVTGLTLKQCQSMNKLEQMLEYLYQRENSEIDWIAIAFKFGFSDQPHLIRYLKKQIGLTPKAYSKERGLTIDVYGGISND